MKSDDNQILIQLRAIKRWIAVGAIGFLFIGGAAFVLALALYSFSGTMEHEISKLNDPEDFRDKATTLFEQGKSDELLKLANEHMQEFPNDSDAYWYRARAYLLKKEWAKALTDLNQTAFLAPNWKAEYTDPLIAEVRLRAKAK